MKAATWQGNREVSVENVPEPVVQEPTDAVIQVTSTASCGSDLHLYEVLRPFMTEGDVSGHEPMGVVVSTGRDVTSVWVGDRVVAPFTISCGHCAMCKAGLQSQCETTQVRRAPCTPRSTWSAAVAPCRSAVSAAEPPVPCRC